MTTTKTRSTPRTPRQPTRSKAPTGPLPLAIHLLLGDVDQSSHLALVVCYDSASHKQTDRVAHIRDLLGTMRGQIGAVEAALDEYARTLETGT